MTPYTAWTAPTLAALFAQAHLTPQRGVRPWHFVPRAGCALDALAFALAEELGEDPPTTDRSVELVLEAAGYPLLWREGVTYGFDGLPEGCGCRRCRSLPAAEAALRHAGYGLGQAVAALAFAERRAEVRA